MVFVFGAFELDVDAGELRRAGQPVALQPRVFETLHYLVVNAGRVVSRDELIEVLWDGQQLNEVAVPWSISHARKALQQSGRERRPIETVRGRGYRFAVDVKRVTSTQPGATPSPAAPPGAPLFVGRDAIMTQLSSALDAARAGQGRLCLLTGEAGIGKTRCASELVARASSLGIGVAIGRCVDTPIAPAFWPFVQILRQMRSTQGLSEPTRREADELLERLAPRGADAAAATSASPELPDEASFWLLDRLCRWVVGSAAQSVRVLVIDDLHWADDRSLQLLSLLSPELASARLLVIATARDRTDEQRASELARRLRPCQNIPLHGLGEAEVGSYIAGAMGQPAPLELARAVLARTAGNPLFVHEAVGMLLAERSKKGAVHASDVKLPELARGFLLERMQTLSPATRGVLETASVIGQEFDLPVLQRACDSDARSLLATIDEAIDRGVVEPSRSPDGFAFAHDLLREVLYQALTVARRAELHGRVALALEAIVPTAPRLSELAYHFYHALPAADHDRVVRYCRLAGLEALRVFAYEKAVTYNAWALSAERAKPKCDPKTVCELLVWSAAAAMSAGLPRESREHCSAAIELAREQGFAELLVAATRFLRPSILVAQQHDNLLVEALEEALALLPDSALSARAQAYSRLAGVPPYSLSIDRSEEVSAKAVSLARESGEHTLLLEALRSRFHALSGPERVDELLSVADEVLGLDTRAASFWSAEARLARYQALSLRGDVAAAAIELEAYGRAVDKLRLDGPKWEYERLRAQQLFHAGELDRAEQRFEELWAEAQRLGLRWAPHLYAAQRSAIRLERAGPRSMVEEPMRERAAPRGMWEWIQPMVAYRVASAELSLRNGQPELARKAFFALTKDSCRAVPRDVTCLSTLIRLSRLAIGLQEMGAARELYSLLGPYADYNPLNEFQFWLGSTSHHLGVLARAFEQQEQAEAYFDAAMQMNHRIGYIAQALRSQVALARTLIDSSSTAKHRRGRELAKGACDAAQELGISWLATRAARLL